MRAVKYTRVAAVQIACHPALSFDGWSPLEDPIFTLGGSDTLALDGQVPPALDERMAALRARVRAVYLDQLARRLRAILARCRAWDVKIVLFPEYSVPWELLDEIVAGAGDMVVVAGTHTVDRQARRAGVYERLGAANPALGQSVCPVVHRGRLLALQPKLSPARPELGHLKPGDRWSPVALPDGLPGPMGVLICKDFLHREGEAHRALVASQLAACLFLAVPSLTPRHSLPEFAGKAWEEARRYGRPVLYADTADGGGTSIFVDEGRPADLRRFPERAGLLEAGDEGVIVADVDLGFVRPGGSTRFDEARPIKPVAAASLLHRAHPIAAAHGAWLAGLAPLLARDDDDAVEALADEVGRAREPIVNLASLPGAQAREARLRRLAREYDRINSVESFRRYLGEVDLPPDVLPLPALRSAMAAGAADALFDWQREFRRAGLETVRGRLEEAGRAVASMEPVEWTEEARAAVAAVRAKVADLAPKPEAAGVSPATAMRIAFPAEFDPAILGERRRDGFTFWFRAIPDELRAFGSDEAREPVARSQSRRGPRRSPVPRGFGDPAIDDLERLHLLSLAEGAVRACVMEVSLDGTVYGGLFSLTRASSTWRLRARFEDDSPALHERANLETMTAALEAEGFTPLEVEAIPRSEIDARVAALLPAFAGASDEIAELRALRLRNVNDQFVEPTVTTPEGARPALQALDAWLCTDPRAALLLGQFGSGKSTILAEWAHRRWQAGAEPLPILCNLAAASATMDDEALLLAAALLPDEPKNRAALRLLIYDGKLLPCFDGLDEMATRVAGGELAGRLSRLLGVAQGGGRVLLSSRDHYIETEQALQATTADSPPQSLGGGDGLLRLRIEPFSDAQVRALVKAVLEEATRADEALRRIDGTYDLVDMVHRPLLLAMVLGSLDRINPSTRIAPADVYDLYLERWLEHTREDGSALSYEQKVQFAEALAEQLWRSGSPSCTWEALRASVRERVNPRLPDHIPPRAAFVDIQSGAFFVRDGDGCYRFAHKSFLEYFLARALIATLEARPQEALDTQPLTREVANFIGEVLRTRGAVTEAPAVRAVQRFLGDKSAPQGQARCVAAGNAIRLLVQLERNSGASLIPAEANVPEIDLAGEDLRGAQLKWAQLRGANLSSADLTGADLTQADLRKARLVGARLDSAVLRSVDARYADLTLAEANHADLSNAHMEETCLRQSTWAHTTTEGARFGGADITASVCHPGFDGVAATPGLSPALMEATVTTGHHGPVNAVTFSPDGRILASAADDGTVRLWDPLAMQERAVFRGHWGPVCSVAFSPDGTRLVSASEDCTIRLWDPFAAQERAVLRGHWGPVCAVAFSRDGTQLAAACADGTIRLWDPLAARERTVLCGHSGQVWSVAFSQDGARLASAGQDGTVRLWNLLAAQEHVVLRGHSNPVWSVAFSRNSARLASAGADGTIRLWDPLAAQERGVLRGPSSSVWSVTFSHDGTRLASADADGVVRLWDAISAQERAILRGHFQPVRSVAFSFDDVRLASAGEDGTVRLWDPRSARERAVLHGHEQGISAVAFSHEGGRLASAGADGTIRLWDPESARERAVLRGHIGRVRSVAFSGNGARLASAGSDDTVRLWDPDSARERAVLDGHQGVSSVAFSSNGARLASAGSDGTIRLWDPDSTRELAVLRGHIGSVCSVAFSRDGARLASAGSDGTVRLWDPDSARERAVLHGHDSGVRIVAFSHDDAQLASAGDDGTVRLWDPDSAHNRAVLHGHDREVRSVAFSRNGARLASAADDGTVRLWDPHAAREHAVLRGHDDGVSSVDFSHDGARLASAGDDGTVRLWDVRRGELLCTIRFAGDASLSRTPGGFCLFGDGSTERYRFAAARLDGSRTRLYVPLGAFRSVLHRPDKVRAALAGDRSGDNLRLALREAGLDGGIPWDGEAHLVPTGESEAVTAPPSPPARPRPNPFRPGPALTDADDLPGRAGTLRELCSLVEGRSPAILIGHRRAGKTSLLAALRRRLGDARPVRSVTLEIAHPRRGDELALLLEPSLVEPGQAAARLHKHISAGPAPVYLIDEVAHLVDAEFDLFPWIRAIGQGLGSIVLAGSWWDWVQVVRRASAVCPGSSFGNDVTPVVLGPIAEDDALRFFANRAPDQVPPAVARWILELCGPWPFYLQVMGHGLFEAWHEDRRAYLGSRAALIDIYEQRLLVGRGEATFGARLRELPDFVQALLLAHPDERPIFRELPLPLRTALIDCGLATAAGVWLNDKPFFDWIRRMPNTATSH